MMLFKSKFTSSTSRSVPVVTQPRPEGVPGLPAPSHPHPMVPPTYSSVMCSAEPRPLASAGQSSSFIAPLPPPTYADSQGIYMERPVSFNSDDAHWGPNPLPTICSRCNALIVTSVSHHCSKGAHMCALVLCVFGCWPCTFLPYYLNYCKSTQHHCPVCERLLGLYAPC